MKERNRNLHKMQMSRELPQSEELESLVKKSSELQTLFERGSVWQARAVNSPTESSYPRNLQKASKAHIAERQGVTFGIPEVDAYFEKYRTGKNMTGALPFGAVHEWIFDSPFNCQSKKIWYPPSFIVHFLLGRMLKTQELSALQEKPLIVWVGKKAWPTPYSLELLLSSSDWSWQEHCLFIDPETKDERLRTLTELLHSKVTFAVIGDGSGFSLLATRRLQLAARKENALCLLYRPPWEAVKLSAAHSRWKVATILEMDAERTPVQGKRIQKKQARQTLPESFPEETSPLETFWEIELTHAKGTPCPKRWVVQFLEKGNLDNAPSQESGDAQQNHTKENSLSLVQRRTEDDNRAETAKARIASLGV